ncbi:MAG: B12-binding domain-containing radical SAM protein [Bacteroidetes bacterium]|nr:B12-binding domain-containing radical SAM protein [Bacteroidota bacterium]
MRVLFSHSWFMHFDQKQDRAAQPYPPYGTILAAAFLRENGHRVQLFDPQFSNRAGELIPFMEKFSPHVFVIFDDGFNYLTKMCLTNMREAAFEMQRVAKKFSSTVVVCSSDASDHYEKYLDNGADFVIRGEAEQSLLMLVNELRKKNIPENIPGLVSRKNGKTICNRNSEVMKDLDLFPVPAWDLLDIEKYRSAWMAAHDSFSLNVATTRGCPYKCNWCAKPIYGNRYNSRSPEKVVEELSMLQKKFSPDHFWFADDIFGLKPGWVKKFANILEVKGLKIKFKIQSRADLLVQENYVNDLARAGCESVWMGAESGSQKILDAMEKGTTIGQIREATRLLKKNNIHPALFLQFGYPGEMKEDIEKTIALVDELQPDDIGISVSYPLPGTKFYETVKTELVQKQNWSDSDDLELMFSNFYPKEFYRILHRYVHRRFRRKQGVRLLKKIILSPSGSGRNDLRRVAAIPFYAQLEFSGRKKLAAFPDERS